MIDNTRSTCVARTSVQNLAQFRTTLDFDRKYLRNGSRYHTS